MRGVAYYSDDDVAAAIDIDAAIAAVRTALSAPPEVAPTSIPKALGTWTGGSLHALGAHWSSSGYAGVKVWINTSTGAQSVYCLFDSARGELIAFLQARTLGRLRTAAVSGLGLSLLARPDATTIALLGTGRQASTQLAAAAAVLPLETVRVWSPTAQHRDEFSAAAHHRFGVRAVAAESVAAAVADVPVVLTVTRSRAPFLHRADLSDDVHINAMGAILPATAELAPDVLADARSIVVDDLDSALTNSAELRGLVEADPAASARIHTLTARLAEPSAGPSSGLSIFKSTGLGACDLALAVRVHELAHATPTATTPQRSIEP